MPVSHDSGKRLPASNTIHVEVQKLLPYEVSKVAVTVVPKVTPQRELVTFADPQFFMLKDISNAFWYVSSNLLSQLSSLGISRSEDSIQLSRFMRIKSIECDEVTEDPFILISGVIPVFLNQAHQAHQDHHAQLLGSIEARICITKDLYACNPSTYQSGRFVYIQAIQKTLPSQYLPNSALYGDLVRVASDFIPNPFAFVDPVNLLDVTCHRVQNTSVLSGLYEAFEQMLDKDKRLMGEVLLKKGLLSQYMTIPSSWSADQSKESHHCFEGGNAVHSAQVCELVLQRIPELSPDQRSLFILASLAHDLGKCQTFTRVGKASFALTQLSAFGHEFLSFDILKSTGSFDAVRHDYLKHALHNKQCRPYRIIKSADMQSAALDRTACKPPCHGGL